MADFPDKGQRVCWVEAPSDMIARGDTVGTVEVRCDEYAYCRMDGTEALVEVLKKELIAIY
jgi:hypothetical protein